MSAVGDEVRALGSETEPGLRWQAQLIRLLARTGKDNARAHLSEAQADTLDATAVGWDEIADAIDQADAVDNPDQH